MSFRADLHCHSTFSDGSMTPEELVAHAEARGLKGLVITDHDSIAAYPEVLPVAEKAGVRMVTGVEFSSLQDGVSIHVLGYSFDPKSSAIGELCNRHAKRRRERNRLIIKKLAERGMPLDEEAFAFDVGAVGRPHIAYALVKEGYVSTVQEAFKKWIGDKCPCFVLGEEITTGETIDAIHEGGGFAILAHPHLIKQQRVIPKLLSLPFDGIEAYYALFGPKDEQQWVKIASHRNWLITGGSDFHGALKPNIPLGASWVGEETFDILASRFHYE